MSMPMRRSISGSSSRYNVNGMISNVREKINKRLGAEIVKEILVENFNFVDKSAIRS